MTLRPPFHAFPEVRAAVARGEMAVVDTGLGVLIGMPVAREPVLIAAADVIHEARLGDSGVTCALVLSPEKYRAIVTREDTP